MANGVPITPYSEGGESEANGIVYNSSFYEVPITGDMDIQFIFETNARLLQMSNDVGGNMYLMIPGNSTAATSVGDGELRTIELGKNSNGRILVMPKAGKKVSAIYTSAPISPDETVTLYFSDNHVLFELENTMVVSRLIEGEYFRIDQMISNEYDTKITVNKKDFMDCIDRSSLLVRESEKKPLIMRVSDDQMDLLMDSSMGRMNEEIDIVKEGKDILIGFNPRYFNDALRVINDEEITVFMVNPKAPCFIKDEKGSYFYLILPVNINQNQYA